MSDVSDPLRVLIVDDDVVSRIALTGILRREGVETATAIDGEEAVDALSRSDFDVVLVDLQLPGLDGIETARRIRMLAGRAPVVVAISASRSDADYERARAVGVVAILLKPITAAALRPYLRAEPSATRRANHSTGLLRLDPAAFAQFKSDVAAAGGAGPDVVVERILQRLAEQLTVVESATREEVGVIAHTLKASASWIGARLLASTLSELEAMARADVGPAPSQIAAKTRAALEELEALKREIAMLASDTGRG